MLRHALSTVITTADAVFKFADNFSATLSAGSSVIGKPHGCCVDFSPALIVATWAIVVVFHLRLPREQLFISVLEHIEEVVAQCLARNTGAMFTFDRFTLV